jgi:hypothetical protein
MEPKIIEFKKKIITSRDKCVASTIDVTLNNPDNKAINW